MGLTKFTVVDGICLSVFNMMYQNGMNLKGGGRRHFYGVVKAVTSLAFNSDDSV
jgi:hypothetical protein